MPINTNANSRTARDARTSSLMCQIQKSARKTALGGICAPLDNPETKRACCICMPYETYLWQFDDLKAQNVFYKIASAYIKNELIKKGKTPHENHLGLP